MGVTELASIKLPDPLARRHLLEGQLEAGRARAIGEAYLEAGREVEAIDFLSRGQANESLEALKTTAVERGDVFLMRAVSKALDVEPGPDVWTRVAEAAERAGRTREAETARRLATIDA
jgi:hypothetical protein